MAFDAGMLASVTEEIRRTASGAKIEKVLQPERDVIVLQMRSFEGGKRLLINAGPNHPRIGFTEAQIENPAVPPMLCMLLRKHLQGAKLTDIRQEEFERVVTLEFETWDELGFSARRFLIAELMGKYSNLIFADGNKRIISVLRTVDFSMSSLRQLLPGMTYELPPKQEKENPLSVSEETFASCLAKAPKDMPCEKWILSSFCGISSAVAREIATRVAKKSDALLSECDPKKLQTVFLQWMREIREGKFSPSMVEKNGVPVEYAFCELTQYGKDFLLRKFESPSALLDTFFEKRDREEHIRERSGDILKILTAADARIRKKTELQRGELAECEKGATYKKYADLITANLYRIPKGAGSVDLTDYEDQREDGTFGTCRVELDTRVSPSVNAQRFYKKYNKAKNAKVELTRQIARSEEELHYLDSVFDALTHAETANDLAEIREELYRFGYASKMKNYTSAKKSPNPVLAEFRTSGGFRVLCGKNNLQNEYLTHKLAGKEDYWFHAKGMPGSHVVLFCNEEEPDARDFTEAAEIAALFSKAAEESRVEVDYTKARNVKKPAGGKPGLVIYHTNWSCVVTPDPRKIEEKRVKP